jgi:Icc-related predicted phosphoesterase
MSVNKSIKDFILKIKPQLVFSGHLHENARKEDKIGKIKIIKCWAFW